MVAATLPAVTVAPQPAPVVEVRPHPVLPLPTRASRAKIWMLTISAALAIFLLASVAGYWLASLFKGPTPSLAPHIDQETRAQQTPNIPPDRPARENSVAKAQLTDWGEPVDPDHDCAFGLQNGRLHIQVPGSYHDLSTELGTLNAPRLLREVEGDFSAGVIVLGNQPSETRGVSKKRLPFQGAGLLIWQDDKNYIRLERGHAYTRLGEWLCYPNWEARSRGNYVRRGILNEGKLQEDRPVSLRVVRTGDVFQGYYRQDASEWIELPAITMDTEKKLRVGVCTIQNTAAPYDAVFEELKITPAP
jgi:regulation of enolase protein 1 (concanavalin A-like superfamily)